MKNLKTKIGIAAAPIKIAEKYQARELQKIKEKEAKREMFEI